MEKPLPTLDQSSIIPCIAQTGSLDVFASGVVHVTTEYPLMLRYSGLEMEFLFYQDKGGSRWETSGSGNRLTWKLYNFTNQFGQGIIKPMPIGRVNDRRLYCSFFTWAVNIEDSTRVISYNLSLGEEAKDDE